MFDSRCKNDFDITSHGLLTIEVYTMQTANMMAHAKSTSIPVTENVKEANYELDHFFSNSILHFV